MDVHNINLNIHYSAPDEVWDKLAIMYAEMPYWKGFVNGCPRWESSEGTYIEASVETSGLQFYAKMPAHEWNIWITLFKENATKIVGYEVGEPEEGFDFPDYE